MARPRTLLLFLVVAVSIGAALGTTEIVATLAAIPASGDDCCRNECPQGEGPCSGATDDCVCPCCPLPVLAGSGIFVPFHVAGTPLSPAVPPAHVSVAHPPLEHPPK